jgi:hypothetical protein
MIIDKHREYLHTFKKGNEQAINIMFIQFYFKAALASILTKTIICFGN